MRGRRGVAELLAERALSDETDEGENLDEQGEITQRNPRMDEDNERR